MLALTYLYNSDIFGFLFSAALVIAYYAYLRWRMKPGPHFDPHYTIQALNAEARRLWVESVMRDKRDILAVQTLRNSTMVATFLASTAILLIIGTISLSGHGSDVEHGLHSLNVVGRVDPSLWMIKLVILIVDLCVAFFSLTLAARHFHHIGYLLNVPADIKHPVITPQFVTTFLNSAARYYSTGMRAYYFTMPLLFWLFGPHLMVISTLVLILVLYRIDRTPGSGE